MIGASGLARVNSLGLNYNFMRVSEGVDSNGAALVSGALDRSASLER
jgi:hypothetical protein